MRAPGPPSRRGGRAASLYWTFAGAFLLVLLAAAALQGLAIIALVGPMARRWVDDRAELAVGRAAAALAALPAPVGDADIARALRSVSEEPGDPLLVCRRAGGRLVAGRPAPPFFPPGTPGDPDFRAAPAFLHHHPPHRRDVVLATGERVEVAAVAPPRRIAGLPPGVPLHFVLFLPIAVLVAGAAGLVFFRLLIRRLRALEDLARRVADGDLAARVNDRRRDEIGRLAGQLDQMAERLAAARAHLDESDRARRQLLADISHELATPLTSIRGYAETLLDPAVAVSAEERAGFLADILGEAERMDLLVKDILELARLESGVIAFTPERLDWASLARHTVARFEPRFREAGLALRWAAPEAEAAVMADGRRLEQVLENLLMNAIRYVPAGKTVTVALARHDGLAPRLRLTVADDGPGIPAADLPHIFDRFYRSDPARSSATGGSGLGLAIVREIMRRHGGAIWAENLAPGGAAFHIELPAAGAAT